MSARKFIILSVTLASREDGGLKVSSDDLPGLILSGSDRDKTAAAIAPTIEAIFEHRGFGGVRVHRGTPVTEALTPGDPQKVDVHIEHATVQTEQFVVEVAALAA